MEEICKYFVGVKFDGTSKAYYFSTNLGDLKVGDQVIVETISGLELGILTTALMPTAAYTSTLDLKPILRRPTKEDLEDYNLGLKEASMAMEITRREVSNLHLPMNLISANYTLDGSRVTITYTSESRVDFRELLRVLAPQLKCRIELRQIASRDKAKLVGGLGICGLPLCCTTFLNQFDGISISRAKNQMLTLNIPKLSGACGKLICCLLYEDDLYTEAKKDFPRIGTIIHDNGVDYTVETYNVLARSVKLSNAEGYQFISLDDYNAMARRSYHGTPASPARPGGKAA
ncbi:MAG: regulatory iron-sulfur-containing complex subunit RicT [Bacilli bacterium]